MSTTSKTLLAFAVVAGIVGVIGFFGFSPFQSSQVQVATFSPTSSTFGTAKFAGIAVNLANPGANATSSSVLNTDANDRYVTVMRYACQNIGTSKTAYTGSGLQSLNVTAATSSTAAPATNANTNSVQSGPTNIGTSTTQFAVASSTSGSSNISLVWASGSYMTFSTNATNTAQCTFGVDYIGS